MVGTNNHGDSAPDIVEGIKAICDLIKDRQPQAYLVVLVRFDREIQFMEIWESVVCVSVANSRCFPAATGRTASASGTLR